MQNIALQIPARTFFVLLTVAVLSESKDASETELTSTTAASSSRTADLGSTSDASARAVTRSLNESRAGAMFTIVSTPPGEVDVPLGVDGVLVYANPRTTDTLLEHYRRVGLNDAHPGRQSCSARESIWTARPKDNVTVQTDARGRVICTEGEVTYGTDCPAPPSCFNFTTESRFTLGDRSVALGGSRTGKAVDTHKLRGNCPANKSCLSPHLLLHCSVNNMPSGEAYVIGTVADVIPGSRTRVVIAEGALLEKNVAGGTRSTRRIPVSLSNNVLGKSTRDGSTGGRRPQMNRGDPVALICADEGQELVVLQADYASLSRRRTSMTSLATVKIHEKVGRGLSQILNFLSYSTILAASGILAGHGLLHYDPTGRTTLLTKMVGSHYVGSEYHFLRLFISPTRMGEYFRAGSLDNLKILARHIRRRENVQAALGYMASGIGIHAVNIIFPIFILVLGAYLLNVPLLWPIQKIMDYYKRKRKESSAAAAAGSTVEVKSLCPPKRIIVKCEGFQERLQQMG